MRISGITTGDLFAKVFVVATIVLLAPARDLCGWTGGFETGVIFLLAIGGLATMGGLVDAPTAGITAALKRMTAGLPLGLAVLTGLLTAGTFNLREISMAQAEGFSRWLVFHDPFSAVGLLIATVALQGIWQSSLAENAAKNDPRQWTNYAELFVICALLTSVFLGAWYDPFGIVHRLEDSSAAASNHAAWTVMANGLGAAVFIAKTLALVWLERLFGKHLPRYRLDEVACSGVRFLLPAAGFNFLAAAGYLWLVEPLEHFQMGIRVTLAVLLPLAAVTLGMGIYLGRRFGAHGSSKLIARVTLVKWGKHFCVGRLPTNVVIGRSAMGVGLQEIDMNTHRLVGVAVLATALMGFSGAWESPANAEAAATVAPTAPVSDLLEAKPFTDPLTGMTLNLPKGWVAKKSTRHTSFAAAKADVDATGSFPVSIGLASMKFAGDKEENLAKEIKASHDAHAKAIPGYKEVKDNSNLKVEGKPTGILAFTFLVQKTKLIEERQILILSKGKMYILTFASLASTFEKNRPLLDAMIKTIKLP